MQGSNHLSQPPWRRRSSVRVPSVLNNSRHNGTIIRYTTPHTCTHMHILLLLPCWVPCRYRLRSRPVALHSRVSTPRGTVPCTGEYTNGVDCVSTAACFRRGVCPTPDDIHYLAHESKAGCDKQTYSYDHHIPLMAALFFSVPLRDRDRLQSLIDLKCGFDLGGNFRPSWVNGL